MTNDWNKVKQQVAAFRKYINDLPSATGSKASYCYMVTREEIEKLMNQRNDGSKLDGVRIYIGADIINGHIIPNVHVVACEKDGNADYHDYKITAQLPSDIAMQNSSMPLLAEGRPCPVWCSKQNFLNS